MSAREFYFRFYLTIRTRQKESAELTHTHTKRIVNNAHIHQIMSNLFRVRRVSTARTQKPARCDDLFTVSNRVNRLVLIDFISLAWDLACGGHAHSRTCRICEANGLAVFPLGRVRCGAGGRAHDRLFLLNEHSVLIILQSITGRCHCLWHVDHIHVTKDCSKSTENTARMEYERRREWLCFAKRNCFFFFYFTRSFGAISFRTEFD